MNDLTALILTFNEEANIARTLQAIDWVTQIVIVDSFSDDGTLQIARSFSNVTSYQRTFDSFAEQCNFGLSLLNSRWILSLDADYLISAELAAEIQSVQEGEGVHGYSVAFRYCVFGNPLRSTLYPPRTVLYRRDFARYEADGHGHRVRVSGNVKMLRGIIYHDDRKPLSRWIRSQNEYAIVEARHLLASDPASLSKQDRLRRRVFYAAPVVFIYLLLFRGLLLDGWCGWFYVAQRVIAECLLSLRLLMEKHDLESDRIDSPRPPLQDK